MLTRRDIDKYAILAAALLMVAGCNEADDRFDVVLCEVGGRDLILIDSTSKTGGLSDAPDFPVQSCGARGGLCIGSPVKVVLPTDRWTGERVSVGSFEYVYHDFKSEGGRSEVLDVVRGDVYVALFDKDNNLYEYNIDGDYGDVTYRVCRGKFDRSFMERMVS